MKVTSEGEGRIYGLEPGFKHHSEDNIIYFPYTH